MLRFTGSFVFRPLLKWRYVGLLIALAALLAAPATAVPNPVVNGPIPGLPNVPNPLIDISAFGYVEEEFFVSGSAMSYTSAVPLTVDGLWNAVPGGFNASYATRIVVRRPANPANFNGVAVVEWMNVSAGFDSSPDFSQMNAEILRSGYIWVGASVQKVGVDALIADPSGRYATLAHPGDSFSYDILSQIGQALAAPAGTDPLAGQTPSVLLAMGESQSAFFLVTYVNALQPIDDRYDGILIHSRGAGAGPLSQGAQGDVPAPSVTLIRTDLSVPVHTLVTEGDLVIPLLGSFFARQADHPLFRFWEVAGAAHADLVVTGGFDVLGCGFGNPANQPNEGIYFTVLRAALDHLQRWAQGGPPPPSAPLLVETSPFSVARDADGLALGGLRTPQMDVPIAEHNGTINFGAGGFCFLFGHTLPFDAARLAELYPNHGTYVSQFVQSVNAAVDGGFILEADGEALKQGAAESSIGK